MDSISYKTPFLKKAQCVPEWVVVDAKDEVVGRLAARVARLLMGKHRPSYTPHMLCGDRVIVLHADKVRFTGRKWLQKLYVRYTGYPGGQRTECARDLHERRPSRIVEMAIKRMLPKNKLGRAQYRGLYVYAGSEHPHKARKPISKKVKDL